MSQCTVSDHRLKEAEVGVAEKTGARGNECLHRTGEAKKVKEGVERAALDHENGGCDPDHDAAHVQGKHRLNYPGSVDGSPDVPAQFVDEEDGSKAITDGASKLFVSPLSGSDEKKADNGEEEDRHQMRRTEKPERPATVSRV